MKIKLGKLKIKLGKKKPSSNKTKIDLRGKKKAPAEYGRKRKRIA